MRTIIIGDIHGCAKTFTSLLKLTNLNTKEDHLILLGDLFDRGPSSAEVWKEVLRLKKKMKTRLVVIMGNHEDLLLKRKKDPALWAVNGGGATLNAFGKSERRIDKVAEIVEGLPLWHETSEFICVHAGLQSQNVEDNSRDTLLWDREAVCNAAYDGKLAIVGHTPSKVPVWCHGGEFTALAYDKEYDLPAKGIVLIDTACVSGNKLTALVTANGKMILRGTKKID